MADSIRDALEQLLSEYASALDQHDRDRLAATYLDSGTFTYTMAGQEPLGPFRGHEAILGFVAQKWHERPAQSRHVITNISIQRTNDRTATLSAYVTLFRVTDGRQALQTTGIYRSEVTDSDAGWKFAALALELDAPY